MAQSSCLKCGSTNFEMVRNTPKGSAFYYMFVQCSVCGGVVGALDGYNLGEKLRRQDEALRQIASRIGAVIDLPND
ncbi:MAG TPA: hypothetical protein VFC46_12300 [Humisphaera sp.]|nr:hypothetical protein [Humisphaera sp.]